MDSIIVYLIQPQQQSMGYQRWCFLVVNLYRSVSLVTIVNKEPQDVARHKPYLIVLYNAHMLLVSGLDGNSMDNFNIVTLSMELRKCISSPFTTIITVLPLIQSAIGILLDSRNAATASKPNVICATTNLK